jgi:exodeoxyribonuclease V beta subunit
MSTTNPNVLDPLTFPLHGSCLIEASAGTGKTYTIALLYVRLVLDSKMPPEILVVTFTEAATKELRGRIRERLTQAALLFMADPAVAQTIDQDVPVNDDPLVRLRDAFPVRDWPEQAAKLSLAAQWMDEAAISTIHAWCYRMLREHAFDSGSLFKQTLLTDQTEILLESAKDYWRTFVYPMEQSVGNQFLAWFDCPEALLSAAKEQIPLVPVLAQRARVAPEADAALAPAGPSEWISAAFVELGSRYQQLRTALLACLDDFEADLLNDIAQKKITGGLRAADCRKWLQVLRDWSSTQDICATGLSDTARKRLSAEALAALYSPPHVAPPPHPALALIEQILALPLTPTGLDGRLLGHAAGWIHRRMETHKQRSAELGFDDLLIRLDAALQGASGAQLASVIRAQFPVAMIDEFQDTDPVQYRIFDRIYQVAANSDSTAIFMIGDPKQAIYSFRGADIHAYLLARRATEGRHYTLGTNFRATQSLVETVNFCFGEAEKRAEGAFRFGGRDAARELPFLPVKAQGRKEVFEVRGATQAPCTVWAMPEGDKATSNEACMAAMSTACASEIVRLLTLGQSGAAGFRSLADSSMKSLVEPTVTSEHITKKVQAFRPVKSGDIAILVNHGKEAEAVRKALQLVGVKSVYLSDKNSVLSTAQARDVLAWLRACAEPAQDRLVRAALATPTLGLSYGVLDRLNQDELAWEAEVERFKRFQETWRQQGVLAMLYALLHEFAAPARLLGKLDGERQLTDVLHLADILQQESQHLDGEQALIRYLADSLSDELLSGDALQVRLESDADLVQVVTVHKSKGLEYPLVFLPFASYSREARARTRKGKINLVKWHDEQGHLQISYDPDDAQLARADHERLGEDLRKLYVALTRARHALWIGAAPLNGLAVSALGSLLDVNAIAAAKPKGAPPLSQALRQWEKCPHIAVTEPPAIVSDRFQPTERTLTAAACKPSREALETWWIASYSTIALHGGTGRGLGKLMPNVPEDARSSRIEEEAGIESATEMATGVAFDSATEPAIDTALDAAIVARGTVRVAEPLTMHNFFRGAGPGTFLHDLLQWAAEYGFANCRRQPEALQAQIARRCETRSRRWKDFATVLGDWMQAILTAPLRLPQSPAFVGRPAFSANLDVPPHESPEDSPFESKMQLSAVVNLAALQSFQAELEFLFECRQVDVTELDRLVTLHTLGGVTHRPAVRKNRMHGMLKGYIDLVFECQGRYYVVDYKSNKLGCDDAAYTAFTMREEVLAKRYDLQYCLYLLALHRLLQSRLAGYDYDRHVGGAVYLFLRGINGPAGGVHAERPDKSLIEALDRLFKGIPQ